MENFNQKLKDRWQQKRKKSMNWTGLLIKVFILIGLLIVIQKLTRSENIDWSVFKNKPDSVQADTLNQRM